uniref:U2A'/phosphoprotein 32 family A C-terminal domain-containing protein n=1 Tax=Chromera velia CCMP2878 TaxID=1169474 RepID=A0A0G4HZJ3_9ALVE|eukprot:Cvel_1578.t1-p1 / transcript=Cvel_1578.t1 / gene=Cvel_1578 / organism=Chromera_velia_CCMP2878 / gene_product=Protein phosphatase 1 regulatory subunit SDS22, putative / transcript_product=Protein phosphatase 1 regulatory subunit SDS22, putative / location=Cvel_scaffold56:75506-78336(+) / protein_length=801 / sequence_SO=supercontig / SO=protein_coding / is_pseudo=false
MSSDSESDVSYGEADEIESFFLAEKQKYMKTTSLNNTTTSKSPSPPPDLLAKGLCPTTPEPEGAVLTEELVRELCGLEPMSASPSSLKTGKTKKKQKKKEEDETAEEESDTDGGEKEEEKEEEGDLSEVTFLVCRGLGLSSLSCRGSIDFLRLAHLEVVSFSNNSLTDIEPLRELVCLKELNVNFNKLTSLAPLGDCQMLRKVFASNNRITSLKGLESCTELLTLGLFQNALEDFEENLETLSRLPLLHTLDMAANPCFETSRAAKSNQLIVALPSLKMLSEADVSDSERAAAEHFFAAVEDAGGVAGIAAKFAEARGVTLQSALSELNANVLERPSTAPPAPPRTVTASSAGLCQKTSLSSSVMQSGVDAHSSSSSSSRAVSGGPDLNVLSEEEQQIWDSLALASAGAGEGEAESRAVSAEKKKKKENPATKPVDRNGDAGVAEGEEEGGDSLSLLVVERERVKRLEEQLSSVRDDAVSWKEKFDALQKKVQVREREEKEREKKETNRPKQQRPLPPPEEGEEEAEDFSKMPPSELRSRLRQLTLENANMYAVVQENEDLRDKLRSRQQTRREREIRSRASTPPDNTLGGVGKSLIVPSASASTQQDDALHVSEDQTIRGRLQAKAETEKEKEKEQQKEKDGTAQLKTTASTMFPPSLSFDDSAEDSEQETVPSKDSKTALRLRVRALESRVACLTDYVRVLQMDKALGAAIAAQRAHAKTFPLKPSQTKLQQKAEAQKEEKVDLPMHRHAHAHAPPNSLGSLSGLSRVPGAASGSSSAAQIQTGAGRRVTAFLRHIEGK